LENINKCIILKEYKNDITREWVIYVNQHH
jgi:hypothetical protein